MDDNFGTNRSNPEQTIATCRKVPALIAGAALYAASLATPASADVLQVDVGEVVENTSPLLLDSLLSYNDGHLTNSDSITNTLWLDNNGTLDNTGTLINTDTLTNYGTLINSGTFTTSYWVDNDGTLENSSIMNITGTGVVFNFDTLDNSGTLNNDGLLDNEETLNNSGTLNNTGTIDNFGTLNNTGTFINTGTLTNIGTVINSGTFENTGTLQNYGTLNLTQLSGSMGMVQGNISNGDTIIFDLAGDATYSGTMTGNGTLTVTGNGTLNLSGTVSQADGTVVSAGGLAVNGVLTSDLSLASGTVLSGSGTIIGNITVSGNVAPGNSQGTLNVTGDFTMDAASVFQVELDASGSDVLAVSGTATLAGTMALDIGSATITPGTTYDVLTAGALVGSFDTITGSVHTFVSMKTSYSPTTVTLTATRLDYTSAASTSDQFALAGALDAARAAGGMTGDTLTVLTALDTVGSVDAAAAAFDQMGAENYGAFITAAQIVGDGFAGAIHDRMSAARHDGAAPRLWITGHGGSGKLDPEDTLEGYKIDSYGIAAGAEFDLGGQSRGGIAGGFSTGTIKGDALGRTGDFTGYQIGAYARTRIADLNASLSAFYSLNDGDMDRPISFGSLSRTATAALEGSEFRVSGFVSRDWFAQGLNLAPYAGLEYSDLSFDAFSETGADALNLSVDTLDGTRLLGEAGIRVSKQQDGLTPTAYIGYRFDFDHDDLMVDANLMGQNHAGRALDRGNGSFVLGAGISGTTSSNIRLYLRYDAEMSSAFSSHKASGGVKVTF